jgi:hypothetical protein
LSLLGPYAGGQANNRDQRRPALTLDAADFARGLQAVHHRHLQVHQD